MQQKIPMKKFLLLIAVAFVGIAASSQMANPVNWTFTSKKISDGVYEIQLNATLQQGWHLYSQTQPKDAIAQPTSFSFNKNPLLEINGKVKENGKMEKFTDKELGVSANQYSKQVSFVQTVKLKGKAKTNAVGNVTFQTCDDKKCLPPKTVAFSVALN